MSLFGSYRDDRRRRSLAEDSAGEDFAAQATVTSKPSAKPQRYHSAARRENHRPTTDFVPRSWWKHSLFYFAGLLLIGGLLAGAAWVASADSIKVTGLFELLDVSQAGSLVRWFSSLIFLLAAGGSMLIYSVRRHKVDDYRGRYRLWLWCALTWMVMSVDATANLHRPFSHAMAVLTGWSLAGTPDAWWIGVWGTILAILAMRLFFETRECRAAMLSILAVATLWIAALAIEFGWVPSGGNSMLIAAGCRAIGQLTLLLSIGLYARHVLLDAEGLILIREAKPKREKPPKKPKAVATAPTTDLDSGKTTRIDAAHKPGEKQGGLAAHVKSVTAANRSTANVASTEPRGAAYPANRSDDDQEYDNRYQSRNSSQRRCDDEESDDNDDGQRKLSKAERKRLRKQMRRQQRDEEE